MADPFKHALVAAAPREIGEQLAGRWVNQLWSEKDKPSDIEDPLRGNWPRQVPAKPANLTAIFARWTPHPESQLELARDKRVQVGQALAKNPQLDIEAAKVLWANTTFRTQPDVVKQKLLERFIALDVIPDGYTPEVCRPPTHKPFGPAWSAWLSANWEEIAEKYTIGGQVISLLSRLEPKLRRQLILEKVDAGEGVKLTQDLAKSGRLDVTDLVEVPVLITYVQLINQLVDAVRGPADNPRPIEDQLADIERIRAASAREMVAGVDKILDKLEIAVLAGAGQAVPAAKVTSTLTPLDHELIALLRPELVDGDVADFVLSCHPGYPFGQHSGNLTPFEVDLLERWVPKPEDRVRHLADALDAAIVVFLLRRWKLEGEARDQLMSKLAKATNLPAATLKEGGRYVPEALDVAWELLCRREDKLRNWLYAETVLEATPPDEWPGEVPEIPLRAVRTKFPRFLQEHVTGWIADQFGENTEAWETFASLSDSWDGTVGELVHLVLVA